MAKNPSLKVYNQNLQYFNVLKQHVDPETANRFFNVQMDLDDPKKIHDNLGNIRAIYDAIMKCCLSFWPELMRLIDSKGRPTSFGWEWAKALQDESRTNSIQTNFFMSIMRIGSSFGAHKMPEEERIYKPTLDTVYSLSYALRDIILWFEKARPK
jgi:hypothetical protein